MPRVKLDNLLPNLKGQCFNRIVITKLEKSLMKQGVPLVTFVQVYLDHVFKNPESAGLFDLFKVIEMPN